MFQFRAKTHRSGRVQATRLIAWLLSLSVLTGVAGVVSRANISRKNLAITAHNKAFYLSATDADFIRPGLVVKIESASIDSSGVITTKFKLTDPKGLPLDQTGVTTPGAISTSFIAATIKAGGTQYTAYTTRVRTGKITVTQAAVDANGTYQQVADGEYTYTFNTKAPAGYDPTATHTIGVYATRDLQTDFNLGMQYDNDEFNFVPNGSPVTVVRDVVRTEACNRCHDPLSAHGGRRRDVALCVLCHQPQTADPVTGNTVNYPVLIHKIHMGSSLPSVIAGTPYGIGTTDFSTVVFPADVRRCEMCHVAPGATASLQPAAATEAAAQPAADDPSVAAAGAAQQNNYLTKPSQAACGACHDDVNFATGKNHAAGTVGPQTNDNQCANCHMPQGENEFDASIKGAHVIPNHSAMLPGTAFKIMNVTNTGPGQQPTVTFSITDKAGNPILPSDMNFLNLVNSTTSTTEYGGVVSESALKATGSNGVYTYTFNTALPANATGTFAVGIEGYRNITLLPGTTKEMKNIRDAGFNQVYYYGVTDSKPVARRTVVAQANCNGCHSSLELHGGIRRNVEYCVLCHNPNGDDAPFRPASALPTESIHFKSMIHKIHRGENLTTDFTIYGFGGNKLNFNDIRFPGDLRDCAKCHVNGSEQLPLPDGELPSVQPRGWFTPQQPTTTACLACHTEKPAAAHALLNTSSQLGEACEVCHGQTADFSIDKVHAR